MTNKKSESRKKTELIQVRATPEEKKALKDKAAAFGVSVGELARQSIFGVQIKTKIDQKAISELCETRADLGRMGGLLKGWLAGAFSIEAPKPNVSDVRKLLKDIEAGQQTILTIVANITEKKE